MIAKLNNLPLAHPLQSPLHLLLLVSRLSDIHIAPIRLGRMDRVPLSVQPLVLHREHDRTDDGQGREAEIDGMALDVTRRLSLWVDVGRDEACGVAHGEEEAHGCCPRVDGTVVGADPGDGKCDRGRHACDGEEEGEVLASASKGSRRQLRSKSCLAQRASHSP